MSFGSSGAMTTVLNIITEVTRFWKYLPLVRIFENLEVPVEIRKRALRNSKKGQSSIRTSMFSNSDRACTLIKAGTFFLQKLGRSSSESESLLWHKEFIKERFS